MQREYPYSWARSPHYASITGDQPMGISFERPVSSPSEILETPHRHYASHEVYAPSESPTPSPVSASFGYPRISAPPPETQHVSDQRKPVRRLGTAPSLEQLLGSDLRTISTSKCLPFRSCIDWKAAAPDATSIAHGHYPYGYSYGPHAGYFPSVGYNTTPSTSSTSPTSAAWPSSTLVGGHLSHNDQPGYIPSPPTSANSYDLSTPWYDRFYDTGSQHCQGTISMDVFSRVPQDDESYEETRSVSSVDDDEAGDGSLSPEDDNEDESRDAQLLDVVRNGITYTTDAEVSQTDRIKRRCYSCDETKAKTWRRSRIHPGRILCNRCGLYEAEYGVDRPLDLDTHHRKYRLSSDYTGAEVARPQPQTMRRRPASDISISNVEEHSADIDCLVCALSFVQARTSMVHKWVKESKSKAVLGVMRCDVTTCWTAGARALCLE
ncbi:hypothetical protein IAR55_003164 [Kwoniella newhampshirensis]|uniref:GATA-type domain-containing protein n=1 Tax=Kwoniella newhampshirensis TaxID=1651941 RepID=A0AAW0YSL9_9TREE